ncbi:MAG: PD-(D/E)XK nuclease family protein [Leptolyngbyaceae cyanobacterium bins.59]|nr:PD-(D/E)XK nuclease family protein [Leptolyngbyaceae cyanobacterium bins.59]
MTSTLVHAIQPIDTAIGRFYQTPIGALPAVNTILSATEPEVDRNRLQHWQAKQVHQLGQEAAEASAIAARERGTQVHALIEAFLRSGTQPNESALTPEILLYWKSIRCWLRQVGNSASVQHATYSGSVDAIELPVYHAALGYAGTIDWVGEWEVGDLWIVDFKTSQSPKRLSWLQRYRLQIAAYRLAFQSLFEVELTKAVIAIAIPHQPAQIFELTPEQLVADEAEWLQRLTQFQSLTHPA